MKDRHRQSETSPLIYRSANQSVSFRLASAIRHRSISLPSDVNVLTINRLFATGSAGNRFNRIDGISAVNTLVILTVGAQRVEQATMTSGAAFAFKGLVGYNIIVSHICHHFPSATGRTNPPARFYFTFSMFQDLDLQRPQLFGLIDSLSQVLPHLRHLC